MRALLLLLSLLIAFVGGVYFSKSVPNSWLSSDMHRPLDQIADEIISDSQFKRLIDRAIDTNQKYYQYYPEEFNAAQHAQVLAYYEANEESIRNDMRKSMRQFLTQKLSREELITVNEFYKTQAGHQFEKILFTPDEQKTYGIPHGEVEKEVERIRSAMPQKPASTSKPTK